MLEAVTLDQLRMLIAIADTGSFSAAAKRLKRAQSAVSHGVGQLETALGLKLFDRGARRPRLTEAGETVLADARSVVTRTAELRARARSIAEDTHVAGDQLDIAAEQPVFSGPQYLGQTALADHQNTFVIADQNMTQHRI